ncbi:hypothetical protein EV401DRAFT_1899857 [Pisolithus croceorrhizus]|nr:hypothetical protein EV401DRAFT_1899857 [Pisolithus croceorrhizus]
MHYSEDSSFTKFIVALTWILDTLHVSFMCHMLYYYLIINYGNPMSLEYIVWFVSLRFRNTFPLITHGRTFSVSISVFLQGIVCRRQLRWLVIPPIIVLILVGFGKLVNNALSFAFYTRFYTSTPAVSAVVLAEVLITASLCILLYDGGSRSAAPRTKRLLNTLLVYAVNRCLLTLTTVAFSRLIQDAAQTASWPMHRWKTIRQFASSVTEHQRISSIPGFRFRVGSTHEYHVLCGRAEAVGGHGDFKGRCKGVSRVRSGCQSRCHYRTSI